MASNLQEEVNCPICMDTLQEPTTIDCGHTFCYRCITQVGNASHSLRQCPLCKNPVKRAKFKPNWLLVSLVEKIRAMGPAEHRPEEKEPRCQHHGEKLHYFCEQDGEILCLVCREAREHKSHSISLMEEAAKDYQVQIESQVEVIEQKKMKLKQEKRLGEQALGDSMAWVLLEKEKILKEFRSVRQCLEEVESSFLSMLGRLELDVAERTNQYVIAMEEQLNFLQMLTESLEAKLQMPPLQLLEDIKEILSWKEKIQFLNPSPVPLNLAKKISEAQTRRDSIVEILKTLKECLLEESDPELPTSGTEALHPVAPLPELSGASGDRDGRGPAGSPGPARTDHLWDPVTLDTASAHPDLTLSEDRKTVTLGLTVWDDWDDWDEPEDPERFYPAHCVLGCPGFSSGLRAWEVELQGPPGRACAVGVASEFASRRGCLLLEPAAGFWALRVTSCGCQALTESCTRENFPVSPKKVGILVDHDGGEVTFYDATTNNNIYTFHASFAGQISPFFQLLTPGTRIIVSP